MTENNFWEILDKLDWTHEGDDEKVMEPVKNALAQLSDEDIFEFDNIMSSKLYDLDSRERAQKLYGTLEHFSADTFLYNRCVVAILFSFAATCKANAINYRQWLEDVLIRINTTPASLIDTLLPQNWKFQPRSEISR